MAEVTQQQLEGVVSRVSSTQTIQVTVKYTKTHPLYRKRYTVSRHFVVHDPESASKVGDIVKIGSCKPISKSKRWTVLAK